MTALRNERHCGGVPRQRSSLRSALSTTIGVTALTFSPPCSFSLCGASGIVALTVAAGLDALTHSAPHVCTVLGVRTSGGSGIARIASAMTMAVGPLLPPSFLLSPARPLASLLLRRCRRIGFPAAWETALLYNKEKYKQIIHPAEPRLAWA